MREFANPHLVREIYFNKKKTMILILDRKCNSWIYHKNYNSDFQRLEYCYYDYTDLEKERIKLFEKEVQQVIKYLQDNPIKFKEIKNKESYLKKNYIFYGTPKLTDKRKCIHCGNDFVVGDYKVKIEDGEEYIVCPNAPECDGDLLDWMEID